jgi:hypothetical protein
MDPNHHSNGGKGICPSNGIDGKMEEDGKSKRYRSWVHDEAGLHRRASYSESHALYFKSPMIGQREGVMP